MSKIIIKKINNITKREVVEKVEEDRRQKIKQEKLYEFLTLTKDKSNNKLIDFLIEQPIPNKEETINYIYNELFKVKSKEELTTLYKMQIDTVIHYIEKSELPEKQKIEKSLKALYESENDNLLNNFSIKIIKEYYNLLIKSMDFNTISTIQSYTLSDKSKDKIMKYSKINISSIEQENTIYKFSKKAFEIGINNRYYYSSETHLCGYCKTGALDCPKLLDEYKKNIARYSFILDGEQIYNPSGVLETFTVKRCLKYQKMKAKGFY